MRGKHLAVMLACFFVPIAALTAVFAFHVPPGSAISFAFLLLCELVQLFFIQRMGHDTRQRETANYRGPENVKP